MLVQSLVALDMAAAAVCSERTTDRQRSVL